jgi:hypothetical protein
LNRKVAKKGPEPFFVEPFLLKRALTPFGPLPPFG